MTIVGLTFTKISAEKEKVQGALKVTNNITLKSVEDAKVNLIDDKQTSLHFNFTFSSNYSTDAKENIANINLEGYVIYLEKNSEAKKILDEWKKSKKIDPKILENILNYALDKSNIESIIMSREIGLPAPVKLPRITAKK